MKFQKSVCLFSVIRIAVLAFIFNPPVNSHAGDSGQKISLKMISRAAEITEKLQDMMTLSHISNPENGNMYEMKICQKFDENSDTRGIVIIEKPGNLKGMAFLFKNIQDHFIRMCFVI